MTLLNAREPVRTSPIVAALLASAVLVLSACSGESPKNGSAGTPGPVGPPGQPPSGGVPATTAKFIFGAIQMTA